jgi:hypothetical protein
MNGFFGLSSWLRVEALFDGGLRVPPLERQVLRARKKALGMTKIKKRNENGAVFQAE